MWKKRWTSAGTQGITAAGPVDSQRILRMSAESLVRAAAQVVETHSPPNVDTDPGETSETAGGARGRLPRAGAQLGGGREAGGGAASRPRGHRGVGSPRGA